MLKPREDGEDGKTRRVHTMPESVYSEDADLPEARGAMRQRGCNGEQNTKSDLDGR